MVQSNKYYKSHAVAVTSEVGLTTDRSLAEPSMLKKENVFYTSVFPEVTCYEPQYMFTVISRILVGWGPYPSVDTVYSNSTAPADWAAKYKFIYIYIYRQLLKNLCTVCQHHHFSQSIVDKIQMLMDLMLPYWPVTYWLGIILLQD